MQDGATSHTTDLIHLNINILIKKLCGRVISHWLPLGHNWPPYSLDLNPFDSFVWEFIEDQVWHIQPELILRQQQAVMDVAATIPMEKLRDGAQNVRKRVKACIEASGGHFEHFL